MKISGWKYYNHAAIPDIPPHRSADLSAIESGDIWKLDGSPLLARWTTDFDKLDGGEWWFVIKDSPFDITSLKAKRRSSINKGIKSFDVKLIDPKNYKEELFNVHVEAFSAYPEKYRPTVIKDEFFESLDSWDRYLVFGAFFKENGLLAGYSLLTKPYDNYVDFSVQKTIPSYEKYSLNAALCAGMLSYFNEFLSNGGIIVDGARNINHETGFQDYLEKNFGFRKAYCKLHLAYKPKMKILIKCLYPFRGLLNKFDGNGKIHAVNSVLKMETIARSYK
jgi:hypothetical protein